MSPRCIALCLAVWGACSRPPHPPTRVTTTHDWRDEVFYHVFVRSFFDSNGDRHGDLAGIRAKLDYLQSLGVTGIWLSPLVSSRGYHNYFASDFFSVDAEYGTMEDFRQLNLEAHRRGLKVLLDMETQVVGDDHPWYVAAKDNPKAPEWRFLLCRPPLEDWCEPNTDNSFDGLRRRIIPLDLFSDDMLAVQKRIYHHWLDPDGDGDTADGLDGFRIDHVEDHLDGEFDGPLRGVLRKHWAPILASVRSRKPDAFFLAEQARWNYPGMDAHGSDVLTAGTFDAVFGFPLRDAMLSLDPQRIHAEAQAIQSTAPGKYTFLLLENHDSARTMTATGNNAPLTRTLGGLELLMPGIPELYYGQELGMRGDRQEWKMADGFQTDGNDIPTRTAFRWSADARASGMAVWYADSGPWWEVAQADTTAALTEQQADPRSLWNYYRTMIELRRSHVALRRGVYRPLKTSEPRTLAFTRESQAPDAAERMLVIANLSSEGLRIQVSVDSTERTVELAPYELRVSQL